MNRLVLSNFETILGLSSPFIPGILLSRKPSRTQGNRWFLKRTMVEKNGESTPSTMHEPSTSNHAFHLADDLPETKPFGCDL